MKKKPVEALNVWFAPTHDERIKVGRLAAAHQAILFEYAPSFLSAALELSPFKLPLEPGLFRGNPRTFDGLMGLFDDSLPDGWGRLLVDRRAALEGIDPRSLGPLDRLALIGAEGLGALDYEPASRGRPAKAIDLARIENDSHRVLAEKEAVDLDTLIALAGSPQGARPKVLVQMAPDGSLSGGARDIAPGHRAYLVKFRSFLDGPDSACLERAYFIMAAAAGIEVPQTMVLGQSRSDGGYFAIERFDRSRGRRIHQHTVGGLLELPHGYAAFDYKDLVLLARTLTRSEETAAEVFRRACFNVLAHNRDDHVRNFSFLMSERGDWRLSPAYDLTFSQGPNGEHSTLVLGEGVDPTPEHLLALGRAVGVRGCAAILEEVQFAVARFTTWADEAAVPMRPMKRVLKALSDTR